MRLEQIDEESVCLDLVEERFGSLDGGEGNWNYWLDDEDDNFSV